MTRLARSILSVPAGNPRMIEKIPTLPADVAFLDLEDSVQPGRKAEARAEAARALRDLPWGTKLRAIRVNGLDTPYFYRDLIDLMEGSGGRLDLVIVPKVRRPEDLYAVAVLLDGLERAVGRLAGTVRLEAQIENAEGLLAVESIARATPRLDALHFGPGDFAASMRMPAERIGTPDRWDALYGGHRFHHAMAAIATAARAARLAVVDGPVADIRDLDAFRQSCRMARALGYDGKWCIHPSQIPVANEEFSPSPEEVAQASKVVEAYRAAPEGRGAIVVDGAMVDAASIRMAEATLDLARRAGLL